MSLHPVTVNIPAKLYTRIKRRAAQAHRSVEDEMLEAIATAMPLDEKLSDELEEAISHLKLLDDQALWRAARNRLPSKVSNQLENLHLKRQREGLTESEEQTLAHLIRQYERTMLVRAEAAGLLKQRGHDISQLLHEK